MVKLADRLYLIIHSHLINFVCKNNNLPPTWNHHQLMQSEPVTRPEKESIILPYLLTICCPKTFSYVICWKRVSKWVVRMVVRMIKAETNDVIIRKQQLEQLLKTSFANRFIKRSKHIYCNFKRSEFSESICIKVVNLQTLKTYDKVIKTKRDSNG